MKAEEILKALVDKGKVSAADIEEAIGYSEPFRNLATVIHSFYSHDDQRAVFLQEEAQPNTWDAPAHRYWLSVAGMLIDRLGVTTEEATATISNVARMFKETDRTERLLLRALDDIELFHEWLAPRRKPSAN